MGNMVLFLLQISGNMGLILSQIMGKRGSFTKKREDYTSALG